MRNLKPILLFLLFVCSIQLWSCQKVIEDAIAPDLVNGEPAAVPETAKPLIFEEQYQPCIPKPMEESSEFGAIFTASFINSFAFYQQQEAFFIPPEGTVITSVVGDKPGFTAYTTNTGFENLLGRYIFQYKETSTSWLFEMYIDFPDTDEYKDLPDIVQYSSSETAKDQKSGKISLFSDASLGFSYEYNWLIKDTTVEYNYQYNSDSEGQVSSSKMIQNIDDKAGNGEIRSNGKLTHEYIWANDGTGMIRTFKEDGTVDTETTF